MTVKCRAVCATRASPSPIKGRASMLSCSVEPKLLNNTELGTTTWSWCCLSSTVNRRTSTRVREYASTRVREYASTPVRQYASTRVREYASTRVREYASTRVREYASTPVREYVSTPVRQYASTEGREYGGAEFLRHIPLQYTSNNINPKHTTRHFLN